MMNCPSDSDFRRFLEDGSDDLARREIELHVNECQQCQDRLDGWAGGSVAVAIRPALSLLPRLSKGVDHPFGNYLLLEVIGRGGMGVVYKALHRRLKRLVALKVISPEFLAHPDAVRRFHREVEAVARLEHPNIVKAQDADEVDGTHFLVMEFIEGTNLTELLKRLGRLPVALACDSIRQAALGLQHAHECGLVHRDVKPGNLMRTPEGVVKVLDLGLARLLPVSALDTTAVELTQTGEIRGTPDYLAPEQASDLHSADIRADIYALGCSLYHLLTGVTPFPDGSTLGKIHKHIHEEPLAVETLRPDLPRPLGPILQKMMAKRREDRHQTPAEVATALAPFSGVKPEPASTSTGNARASIVITDRMAAPQNLHKSDPFPSISLGPPEALKTSKSTRRPPVAIRVVAAASLFGLLAYGIVVTVRTKGGTKVTISIGEPPTPTTTESQHTGTPVVTPPPPDRKAAQVLLDQAETLRMSGKLEAAILVCSEAIRIDPQWADAYNLRGKLYARQMREDRTITDLTKQTFGDRAITDLSKAIGLEPRWDAPYLERGVVYVARGELGKAVTEYDEAIRLNPKNFWAHLYRGQMAIERDEPDGGLAAFNEAIRLKPQFAEGYLWRGRVHFKKGRDSSAVTDFTEAIRLDPRWPTLYEERAKVYDRKGERDPAEADRGKARQLKADSAK